MIPHVRWIEPFCWKQTGIWYHLWRVCKSLLTGWLPSPNVSIPSFFTGTYRSTVTNTRELFKDTQPPKKNYSPNSPYRSPSRGFSIGNTNTSSGNPGVRHQIKHDYRPIPWQHRQFAARLTLQLSGSLGSLSVNGRPRRKDWISRRFCIVCHQEQPRTILIIDIKVSNPYLKSNYTIQEFLGLVEVFSYWAKREKQPLRLVQWIAYFSVHYFYMTIDYSHL